MTSNVHDAVKAARDYVEKHLPEFKFAAQGLGNDTSLSWTVLCNTEDLEARFLKPMKEKFNFGNAGIIPDAGTMTITLYYTEPTRVEPARIRNRFKAINEASDEDDVAESDSDTPEKPKPPFPTCAIIATIFVIVTSVAAILALVATH